MQKLFPRQLYVLEVYGFTRCFLEYCLIDLTEIGECYVVSTESQLGYSPRSRNCLALSRRIPTLTG